MRYAGFWIRLCSSITDLFLIFLPILYIVIYFVPGLQDQFLEGFLIDDSLLYEFQFIMNFFVGLEIVLMLWLWNGATFGKKLFNLRIIKKNGNSLSLIDAIRHYLSTLIYFIPLVFIISILMVVFRKDKRTLHDLIAGTVVIYNQ